MYRPIIQFVLKRYVMGDNIPKLDEAVCYYRQESTTSVEIAQELWKGR